MNTVRNGALLSVRDLGHTFRSGKRWGGVSQTAIQALKGINFEVEEGECLSIVGESGAGKTTLVRCLLRLLDPTEGEVRFRGDNVLAMAPEELLGFRKKAQIVFQDPFGSLNPRLRAGPMLEEVFHVHGRGGKGDRREAAEELLDLVGLHTGHWNRFPHELSGGQRQRLGIARALSVDPDLLILDEPVSALDLSVQAQILNLLRDLQESLSLTTILVAHDLSVVKQMADRVAVMNQGEIVELSPSQDLFDSPSHSYTLELLEAAGWEARKGRERG